MDANSRWSARPAVPVPRNPDDTREREPGTPPSAGEHEAPRPVPTQRRSCPPRADWRNRAALGPYEVAAADAARNRPSISMLACTSNTALTLTAAQACPGAAARYEARHGVARHEAQAAAKLLRETGPWEITLATRNVGRDRVLDRLPHDLSFP